MKIGIGVALIAFGGYGVTCAFIGHLVNSKWPASPGPWSQAIALTVAAIGAALAAWSIVPPAWVAPALRWLAIVVLASGFILDASIVFLITASSLFGYD